MQRRKQPFAAPFARLNQFAGRVGMLIGGRRAGISRIDPDRLPDDIRRDLGFIDGRPRRTPERYR